MSIVTAAVVSAGTVANLIRIDASEIGSVTGAVAIPDGVAPQIGWTYAGGVFTAPAVPQPSQADLIAYANRKQWALATGGFTLTIATISLTFSTDATSMGLITGKAARLQQPNPPTAINWQFATGFVEISAADFTTAATEIADFVQATFDALAVLITAIGAGTVTTTAAIDAYAWPPAQH